MLSEYFERLALRFMIWVAVLIIARFWIGFIVEFSMGDVPLWIFLLKFLMSLVAIRLAYVSIVFLWKKFKEDF